MTFSPSDTDAWLRCPRYRQYQRTWVPRSGDWAPNRLVGTATHAGLAAYFSKCGQPLTEIQVAIDAGYVEQPQYTREALVKLATKAYRLLVAAPGPDPVVVSVEQKVGRAIPDLVVGTDEGLMIYDWKTIIKADDRGVTLRTQDLETSQQRYHYPWAVERALGQPVKWMIFAVAVISPGQLLTYPFEVTPGGQREWLSDMFPVWEQMYLDDAEPGSAWGNTTSCTRFGRCQYYDACHVYHRDESLFPALYGKKGERK